MLKIKVKSNANTVAPDDLSLMGMGAVTTDPRVPDMGGIGDPVSLPMSISPSDDKSMLPETGTALIKLTEL